MLNDDMNDIAHQASLKIVAADKVVDIRHKFRLRDKSTLGVLFFFCAGTFLVALPFIKASDTTTKILGIVIGLLFCVLSTLAVIRQVGDSLKITDTQIIFRHNLKRTKLPLNRSMKIIIKTEVMEVSRVGTLGSAFILVSHYLQDAGKELPILTFQMDNEHSEKAMKLGNEIMRMINDRFQQLH